ncbi:helix-turn-helix domain-containing protein [Micromonospora chokoriensis]
MTTQPEFGERIRRRRNELGLSQRQLAGGSVTASYISLLESGRRAPTLDVIVHLAKNLRLPIEELIGVTPDELLSGTSRESTPLIPAPAPGAESMLLEMRASDDYDAAIANVRTSMQLAEAAQDEARFLHLGIQLQGLLRTTGQHVERETLLHSMLDTELVRGAAELRFSLLAHLATAQRDAGRLAEARDTAEGARLLMQTEGLGGGAENVRLLGVLISALCELGELAKLPALLDEMLALAEHLKMPGLVGRSLWVAARARNLLGDTAEGARLIIEAKSYLLRSEVSVHDWLRFSRSAATLLLADGRLDEAREWLTEVTSTTQHMPLPSEQAALRALQAQYEHAAGNHTAALALYTEMASGSPELTGVARARILQSTAEVLQALGRTEEAMTALREAASISEQGGALQLALHLWRQMDELRQG